MTTPVNCPNCGSQLPPGAPACARCGMRFDQEPEPVNEAPASAPQPAQPPKPASAQPSPRLTGATGTGPAASGDVGKALQQYIGEARERWGLDQTPFLTAVMVLTAIAVLLGSIAHTILLTAGSNDVDKHFDYAVWLTTADAIALLVLVGAVLVRHEASRAPPAPNIESIDFRIGVGIAVDSLLFGLIGAILGLGGHAEAAESWERYATVFAFLSAAWFVLSQSVPDMIGSYKARNLGLIVGGVALGILLIGQLQGLSNSYDSYIGGITLQAMAINIIAQVLGWFLGMPKR